MPSSPTTPPNHPQSDFVLLFRGGDWNRGLSAEQLQRVVSAWAAWFGGLMNSGKAIAGHPLERKGLIVSVGQGGAVSESEFTESDETICGYFHLRVSGFEEAVQIARDCPGLEYGAVVEVRQIAESCNLRRAANAS